MRVAMTLVVRDEVDLVEDWLRYHLARGIDQVIVTDHRSVDGTSDVLAEHARDGRVRVIREEAPEMRQAEWVTRMARLAATDHGADWVINSDADEFWWPRDGGVHELLDAVPGRYGVVRALWRQFVLRPDGPTPFAERMTVRCRPVADFASPYHAQVKIAHRALPDVVVSEGNHDAFGDGLTLVREWLPFEVLHFPLRTEAQVADKFLRRRAILGGEHIADAIRRLDSEGLSRVPRCRPLRRRAGGARARRRDARRGHAPAGRARGARRRRHDASRVDADARRRRRPGARLPARARAGQLGQPRPPCGGAGALDRAPRGRGDPGRSAARSDARRVCRSAQPIPSSVVRRGASDALAARPMSEIPSDVPVTLIRPVRRSGIPDFRELWRARDLALILAWRDVKVRYKQSLIGIAWAVLQPLLTMVVFTIIFGKFADLPAQGLPYPVFSMLNLVAWTFLASVFTLTVAAACSRTACSSRRCTSRSLILPLACILVPLVDFVFSFTVGLGITWWYDVPIQSTIVLAPLFLLMLGATAIGLGSFLAVINVRYRDVPYAVPFLVQLWLFASGVIYAADAIPEKYLNIASLNPAVGAITGFRWAVVGTPAPTTTMLVLGLTTTVILFVGGLWFYRRAEPRFADTL